jgi:hypothetical protein
MLWMRAAVCQTSISIQHCIGDGGRRLDVSDVLGMVTIKYTIFVYYNLMKNITITLGEETATWARTAAAKQNKSLSRFLGELLETTMHEARDYDEAMHRYLAKTPGPVADYGMSYPKRHDLYDRDDLR